MRNSLKQNLVRLICLAVCFWGTGCAVIPLTPDPTPEPTATSTPTPAPTPEVKPLTLLAGGDVLPACFLNPYLQKEGHDYPYQKIAPFFLAADIGLVNLECPLSLRGRRYCRKKFIFRAQPKAAAALKRAGITAVSLGNNHIMDYGLPALLDTLVALQNTGLAYAGAGINLAAARAPAVLSFSPDIQVAILSYSMTYPSAFWATSKRPGTAFARLPLIQADITSATARADWVIVCFHWGGELKNYPREYQVQFGHAAIDFGADVVIGTHPHVLQGVEWYKNRLILYSLGNLVFGGGRSRRAVAGALVKVVMNTQQKRLTAWVMPLNVNNLATAFRPVPLPGAEGQSIFQALETYSQKWGTTIRLADSGWGQLLPPEDPLPLEPESVIRIYPPPLEKE